MILEPPKIKSVTVSIVSPSICHEVMELDAGDRAPLSLDSEAWGLPRATLHLGVRCTCFPHLLLPLFIRGGRTEKMSGKWNKGAKSDW